MCKRKHFDNLLSVQYRAYYCEVAKILQSARRECHAFASIAVAGPSYLRASIEHTQFLVHYAKALLGDSLDRQEALEDKLDTMEEHNRATEAFHKALSFWTKGEQARIDDMRANMEDAMERQSTKRANVKNYSARSTRTCWREYSIVKRQLRLYMRS